MGCRLGCEVSDAQEGALCARAEDSAGQVRAGPQRSQPWSPSFAARFTVGLCGILAVLFSVLLACGVSNSLLGVSMAAIFDELPFLVLFMGVQSVFSLLDASTSTYNETESTVGTQGVVVVDRVNQIALATSLTGPEELLTSLTKAGIALLFCWPLTSLMGPAIEPVADFWVHAGLAVLFKCLLQMSLFASLVQTMLPEWDPARRRTNALLTPDIKCRVCFEIGSDLRRCPCKCTGSVGYIHPVCFQQWFETKKSLRCELCHMIFNVRMVPTSVTTNMQTIESLVADLVPPLTKRLALFAVLTAAILCNKLGFILVDFLADKFRFLLAQVQPRAGGAAGILKERQELLAYLFTMLALMFPSVAAAVVGVVPRVLTEWHRRHRAMHWDGPKTSLRSGGRMIASQKAWCSARQMCSQAKGQWARSCGMGMGMGTCCRGWCRRVPHGVTMLQQDRVCVGSWRRTTNRKVQHRETGVRVREERWEQRWCNLSRAARLVRKDPSDKETPRQRGSWCRRWRWMDKERMGLRQSHHRVAVSRGRVKSTALFFKL